jgi:two-component system, OmpR family, phosphate regulon sensor histidine kinase PhoR
MPSRQELLEQLSATERATECCTVGPEHGLFHQDRDLRYRWVVNELGPFTKARLVGKTDSDFLPEHAATVLTRAKRWVIEARTPTAVEVRIPLDDGEHRYEMIVQPWLSVTGTVLGVTVYARDITEPRLLQKALREQFVNFASIFDALDVIVYVADMETHELLYLNARARALIGHDALGAPCYASLQKGQRVPCPFCTNHLLVRNGVPQPPHRWEFQNTATGAWFLCIDQAIQWTDGRLVRMEVAVDISDRKQTERFREQYIGIISHDLRNPLNVIVMACSELQVALQERGLQDDVGLVNQVLRNANSMDAMIEDLAESAQLEAGELRLRPLPVDLVPVVEDLVGALRGSGRGDRIRIDSGTGSMAVLGDRRRIERILQNLLSNALKYSPSEAPVDVSIRALEHFIETTVADRGLGIDPRDTRRIFERFYRTEHARGVEGLGLGLYITRLLVEAHGGTIDVQSEPGRGTRFRFTLPRVPSA